MRVRYRPRDLLRQLPNAGRPLAPVYLTRDLVTDPRLRDRDLDPWRRAWSPGANVTFAGPDGLDRYTVTFNAPGRLNVTPPSYPPRVYPGDSLGDNVVVVAAGAGTLRQGVTWHRADGTTTETVLAAFGAGAFTARADVPADAVAVGVWVEATGAGWTVYELGVFLESASPMPAALTIRRGRSSEGTPLEPSTLSSDLALVGAAALETTAPVSVFVDLDGLEAHGIADWTDLAPRFEGAVTDVSAVIAPGGPNTLPIVAVSPLADLDNYDIGDTPWPEETALERGARILTLLLAQNAVLPIDVPAGAGGPRVAWRDVDRQPAMGLLSELALDTGLRLLETRDGRLTIALPLPRSAPPAVTLTPAELARPLTMVQEWGPTRVQVEYGTSLDRRVLDVAAGPVDETQTPAVIRTGLATETGAFLRARRELALGAAPVWRVRNITVDVIRLLQKDAAGYAPLVAGILGLQVGDVLQLADLPPEAPALVGEGRVVLVGVNETLTPTSWRFDLTVADAPLLLADETWDDVSTNPETWLDVDIAVSWAAQPAHL